MSVLSHASVGPYETVTLHAEDPNALSDWLDAHDYAIPDDILPVVDAYIDEGFDFIALRLLPGAGVQQMRPVRVVQSGASPTLPLRMVAAGSGARTAITLFVIGEGRYTTSNFAEGTIDTTQLTYDFNSGLTNYTTLRDAIFEQNAQQTFLAGFAMKRALFKHIPNPTTGVPVVFRVAGAASSPFSTSAPGYTTVADAYVQQGFINGEASSTACADQLASIASDTRRVVNLCDDAGECRDVHPGTEIDRKTLACDAPIGSDILFDDAAVALTGLHPADVWVTRLEANLGRSAFGRDLEVAPASAQEEISPFVTAGAPENAPCDVAASIAKSDGRVRTPRERARLGVAVSVLVVTGAVLARRARRKKTGAGTGRDEVAR